MKTLFLVRHAKSSWDNTGIDDIDRPLNERGKKDAVEMAKRLKEKKIDVGLLLSSPAKRALKTAKLFADELDLDKSELEINDKLYPASVAAFLETIHQIKDKYESVIIFSHNPALTEFVNTLTNVHIDDMPTCSIFAVQTDAASWTQFLKSSKLFLFFDYPKNPLG